MGENVYIRSMSNKTKDLKNKATEQATESVASGDKYGDLESVFSVKDLEVLSEINDQYCKTLYARYLNRNLDISNTRCESLNEAVSELHTAVSFLDSENIVKFDLNQSVGDLLAVFGAIEDLNTFDRLSEEEREKLSHIQKTVRYKAKAYGLCVHNNRWDEELLKPFVPSS
mgnify:FL=1